MSTEPQTTDQTDADERVPIVSPDVITKMDSASGGVSGDEVRLAAQHRLRAVDDVARQVVLGAGQTKWLIDATIKYPRGRFPIRSTACAEDSPIRKHLGGVAVSIHHTC